MGISYVQHTYKTPQASLVPFYPPHYVASHGDKSKSQPYHAVSFFFFRRKCVRVWCGVRLRLRLRLRLHVRVRVCVCVLVRLSVRLRVRAHARVRVRVRTHMCVHTHTYTRARIRK